MSTDNLGSRITDFRATSPNVFAAESLRTLCELAAQPGTTVDELRDAAELAAKRLTFLTGTLPHAGVRYPWLAKLTGFAFPRSFSSGPLAGVPGRSREHHQVCFTVQITSGGGAIARARNVEVQVPAAEALKLGQQLVRLAQSFGLPGRTGGQR
jgi:hypothetical protein